ncbi:MAG: Myo-inositol 2-dehydrogenase [Candidatus Moanabacter tarae]|uniref:Myo-inositol 2-dehydrogenase n=1 Tax=Candidatus Moanibacter tarae TaxID=2200854 RepID=A0A2Z4AHI6_9BACT|nr:MAG: Myo-inositol 2-dehydrogenase [Candidatus Moanabacter tarae]|tara:strand:- start:490 stop:1545 length:1056 start_codon:yes stop_codon:yes gene_type:complete
MPKDKIRIGVIGAGGIFRTRHFPGLAKVKDAEVVAICNRSVASGRKISKEFGIEPDLMTDPYALIARDDIDAVMIGTWPYKHCEYVLKSLDAGKHTWVQARMAMNLREAREMYSKSEETGLAAQICQPPHAMKGDYYMRRLIADGYVGDITNIVIRSMTPALLNPRTPLHWRQISQLSGLNTMSVGMLYEFVNRWCGDTSSLTAQAVTFTKQRPVGREKMGDVDRPDTVNILAVMESGATAVYMFSGAAHHAPSERIEIYGNAGTLVYETAVNLNDQRILGAKGTGKELKELSVPRKDACRWTVESDFINSIKTGELAESTFYQGVKYMEFTEAVFRSVERGQTVNFPVVD